MEQDLMKLYNTLNTIETKGINTITMADCLRYLGDMIEKERKKNEEVVSNQEG